MDRELTHMAFDAVDSYFTALTKTGYLDDLKVRQVALLILLDEFEKDFEWLITEDDYRTLDRIKMCIQGTTCLVPYTRENLFAEPMKNYLLNVPVRLNASDIIRTSEGSDDATAVRLES